MLGIPSVDPFHFDYIEAVHSAGNKNFNLKSSLKNVEVSGFASNTKVTRAASKFDKNFAIKSESKTKSVKIIGDYTMEGKILVLPIKGVGKANITLTDVTGISEFRGNFFDVDGETYINITSTKLKLTPQHAYFSFENIFKDDPALSETINTFMNENWELVLNTLMPEYVARIGESSKDIANKVFQKVPMKMVFLE